MGVEIGGVVGQRLNLERFAAHHFAHQILFDDGEGLGGQDLHLIPEVLAGEGGGGEVHEVGEESGVGPLGEGAFAARGAGPGEAGGDDGFADGQAIADLNVGGGQSGIDAGGEVEFDGQTVEGGDGSGADGGELKGDRMLLLVKLKDIVDAPEMGEDAEGGFAVLAKGLDDAVVVDAVGLIGLKRRHYIT